MQASELDFGIKCGYITAMKRLRLLKMFSLPRNRFDLSSAVVLGPGLFFIVVGLVALVAPRLLLAILAAFALVFGVLFVYLGWRLMSFRRNFDRILHDLKSQVSVHAVQIRRPLEEDSVSSADKKIIIH